MLVLPSTSITGAPATGSGRSHVVLVADLAENLFEHVLQRHQSGDGAELIHHHRQMRVASCGIRPSIDCSGLVSGTTRGVAQDSGADETGARAAAVGGQSCAPARRAIRSL